MTNLGNCGCCANELREVVESFLFFDSCTFDEDCFISSAIFLDDERDTFGDGLLDGMDEADGRLS